jgi:hypothetical protein
VGAATLAVSSPKKEPLMAKGKPLLHELLAVEQQVIGHYNAMVKETETVFGKPDHFTMSVRRKQHFDAALSHLNTIETKDMVTTVHDRLAYFFKDAFTKMVDTELQKDATNQNARADVIVNGVKILEGIPATALLNWETKLSALLELLKQIPTLAPGIVWVPDDQRDNCHRTDPKEPRVTFSTKKSSKPVVLYEATKEHPAQVKEVTEDVPIAKIIDEVHSGMFTSKHKADMLARVQALLKAVRKARQRANRTEIVKSRAGQVLGRFIMDGPEFEQLSEVDDEATE